MGVITLFRTVFRLPTRRDQASLRIQYLGKRGLTYPCVQAMATILTSPYPCCEITVVFQEQARGEDHTAVCFVIWDWLDYGITIVPDGFGTHHGTGGWGYPTTRDCEQLHHADHWAPSWPSHLQHYEYRGYVLWTDLPRELSQFPYWLIEPELLSDVKDIERNPGLAVF